MHPPLGHHSCGRILTRPGPRRQGRKRQAPTHLAPKALAPCVVDLLAPRVLIDNRKNDPIAVEKLFHLDSDYYHIWTYVL